MPVCSSLGGGTASAEKPSRAALVRAPGPRAHLDPTWPPAASQPRAASAASTWVPVPSLPDQLSPQPHPSAGHLGPRRPRALPVHLRAGRLRPRRPGSEGAGSGAGAPDAGAGRAPGDACEGTGEKAPPARRPPPACRSPGSCRTARARPPGCGPACGSALAPVRS